MRGLRFAATLNFAIDSETADAMYMEKEGLQHISKERINVELSKLLMGERADQILTQYMGILEEGAEGIQLPQRDLNTLPPALAIRLAEVFPKDTGKYLRLLKYDGNTIRYARVLSRIKDKPALTEPKKEMVKFLHKHGEVITAMHYARAGQEVEIKSRKITISSIDIEKIEGDEITFVVVCSKGTYVRTICKDIGDKLGCGAAMSALTRIASGIFTLEEAIDIEKIKEMSKEEIVEKLYPTDYPLIHFGRINLTAVQAKDFVNGKRMKRENLEIVDVSKHEEMYNVYYGEEFLGVAQFDRHILKSHKVFNVRMQNESI
jgi:hypothetical protein